MSARDPARGRDAVALLAKMPLPGKVKSRLVPPLTHEEAAAVARACLEDTMGASGRTHAADWSLFLDGEPDGALRALARERECRIRPQGDGDLGTRLARALASLRAEGASRVVAIGSDSPTLPPERLAQAFAALDRADVVLGPAEDGGYYLIGTRRDAPALFQGIPWGTPGVARATRAACARAGLELAELEAGYDLDEVKDLARAAAEAAPHCPALAAALAALRDRWSAAAGTTSPSSAIPARRESRSSAPRTAPA